MLQVMQMKSRTLGWRQCTIPIAKEPIRMTFKIVSSAQGTRLRISLVVLRIFSYDMTAPVQFPMSWDYLLASITVEKRTIRCLLEFPVS